MEKGISETEGKEEGLQSQGKTNGLDWNRDYTVSTLELCINYWNKLTSYCWTYSCFALCLDVTVYNFLKISFNLYPLRNACMAEPKRMWEIPDMDPLTTEPTIKLEVDTEPATLAGTCLNRCSLFSLGTPWKAWSKRSLMGLSALESSIRDRM